jgi:ribosomal protein L37AE/L43A
MTAASMRLSTFGALPCAQCGAQLKRPAWSEPVNQRQVRHLWNCGDCGYVFETMVVFCSDATAEPAEPLAA